tara:strand:- start:454 stop:711 length:258 start_codon:yes stop_codon:yes gene_type:complete
VETFKNKTMISIQLKPERIHIQNTTFTKEYGEIVEWKKDRVIVRLFHRGCKLFTEDTNFTRAFSLKTGRAFGNFGKGKNGLKILP